jgi:hypothetical protein
MVYTCICIYVCIYGYNVYAFMKINERCIIYKCTLSHYTNTIINRFLKIRLIKFLQCTRKGDTFHESRGTTKQPFASMDIGSDVCTGSLYTQAVPCPLNTSRPPQPNLIQSKRDPMATHYILFKTDSPIRQPPPHRPASPHNTQLS